MRRILPENFILIGAGLLLAILGWSLYVESRRNNKIAAILSGPVRGNRESHIFHVPTCPQYDAIGGGNIRLFENVETAETAGYRPALNCLEAIDIRSANETEGSDAQVSYEDPRQ